MKPELVALLLQLVMHGIDALAELRANGQLSDADLDTHLASTNDDTRAKIKAALAAAPAAPATT